MGTNIDGKRKVMFAMTAIKGVGRRYANIVLKKADIDLDKRAGECSEEEVKHAVFQIYSASFKLTFNIKNKVYTTNFKIKYIIYVLSKNIVS